jgi:hypothetical protein
MAAVDARQPIRTENNMLEKRDHYLRLIGMRDGEVGRHRVQAAYEGVNLVIANGWISPLDVPSCFGVDPDKDNVHANSPSVMLHAFDEGLRKFFCEATIWWCVHDGNAVGHSQTAIFRRIDAAFARTYLESPQNSNVEVNGRDAFQLFPHGVADFIQNKRRLNANWYGPLSDQLQYFLMGNDILSNQRKKQMCELAHMGRQIHYMIRQPVESFTGPEEYQEYLDVFCKKLIAYNTIPSPTSCNSIKYHAARHWGEDRRQLGCSAMEYSLERALGDHFTKFWGLTNHGRHERGSPHTLPPAPYPTYRP